MGCQVPVPGSRRSRRKDSAGPPGRGSIWKATSRCRYARVPPRRVTVNSWAAPPRTRFSRPPAVVTVRVVRSARAGAAAGGAGARVVAGAEAAGGDVGADAAGLAEADAVAAVMPEGTLPAEDGGRGCAAGVCGRPVQPVRPARPADSTAAAISRRRPACMAGPPTAPVGSGT